MFLYDCTIWGSEVDLFYIYKRGQFRFPILYTSLKSCNSTCKPGTETAWKCIFRLFRYFGQRNDSGYCKACLVQGTLYILFNVALECSVMYLINVEGRNNDNRKFRLELCKPAPRQGLRRDSQDCVIFNFQGYILWNTI